MIDALQHRSGGNSREITMPKNVDEMQQIGKENVDVAMKSFGAMSEGFQAIAAEIANYSKRSFEDYTAAMQNLMGAKSPEKAIEVQSEYVKAASAGFIAEATKMSELYADLAKASYKPFEGVIARNLGSTNLMPVREWKQPDPTEPQRGLQSTNEHTP
jgi:hypothetical protein